MTRLYQTSSSFDVCSVVITVWGILSACIFLAKTTILQVLYYFLNDLVSVEIKIIQIMVSEDALPVG